MKNGERSLIIPSPGVCSAIPHNMNSFHAQILWVIASSKTTLHIWLPRLQNELCVFVPLWCVQLPGNMISSFVPVPLSHMAFPTSNIFSNVCSEPKSSSRTAISFNLQLQSTLMCKTTMAFNHLGVRFGAGRGRQREMRRNGVKNKWQVTIPCLDSVSFFFFFFLRCVCDLCTTLMRCTAADGMCCHLPELPLLTVSKKHTRPHKHMHMRTHAEYMIIPLEGSSAEDITLGWYRSCKYCSYFRLKCPGKEERR